MEGKECVKDQGIGTALMEVGRRKAVVPKRFVRTKNKARAYTHDQVKGNAQGADEARKPHPSKRVLASFTERLQFTHSFIEIPTPRVENKKTKL
jgi:hypothetical protein